MSAVSTTKLLLQRLRNEECEPFFDTVKSFCEKRKRKKKKKLMFLI
jgi:hypothetical protein